MKRSAGKRDLKRRSLSRKRPDDARRAVNVTVQSFNPVPRRLTIKEEHPPVSLISTNYCKGYSFSRKLGSCLQTCASPPTKTSPANFLLLFRPVAKIRDKKGSTARPKDTEELFVLGLVSAPCHF